ncbi:MAG: hypothetical protein L0271_01160 [Gemmatimonadetes bacterium]|nr:hypothetical protein [Gemmatimonadota bacterium]
MRVAVEKIDGVADVEVKLNEGVAIVRLAPENRVSLAQVRRVIREKGFTPKDAELRAKGRVETRGDGLVLVVPGAAGVWTLAADASMRARLMERAGQLVDIAGRVPGDDERGDARAIEVRMLAEARTP